MTYVICAISHYRYAKKCKVGIFLLSDTTNYAKNVDINLKTTFVDIEKFFCMQMWPF